MSEEQQESSLAGIQRAIEIAGGPTALARQLGMPRGRVTVTQWARRRLPAERVLAVEAASGVSRHELRPDLYPAD